MRICVFAQTAGGANEALTGHANIYSSGCPRLRRPPPRRLPRLSFISSLRAHRVSAVSALNAFFHFPVMNFPVRIFLSRHHFVFPWVQLPSVLIREGMRFVWAFLKNSGSTCRTDGGSVTLSTCWMLTKQVGLQEMLADYIRSNSPFP